MNSSQRLREKNEATGMRVVAQFVQEFWECGWQPLDQRNDKGIDGYIIMKHKGLELGGDINVQVKCGSSYVTSINETEIRLSFDDEIGLESHIEYWKKKFEPTILIFVNPSKPKRDKNGKIIYGSNKRPLWEDNRLQPKAWWVNLKDENLRVPNTKTTIRIPIKQTFGEHSKGNFLKLTKPYLFDVNLIEIKPNKESKDLLLADNVRGLAREFYKTWRESILENSNIVKVTKIGWRHILLNRRGKERRINSLRLLGVAKQIIEEGGKWKQIAHVEFDKEIVQKFILKAKLTNKNKSFDIVQVIILRKINKKTNIKKDWFYSVHYRR